MFVDEITLHAYAGRGGNGVVRWLHLKGKEFSGPSGGDGGMGGNVYARAVRDISVLARYRGSNTFRAERGEDGKNNSRHGRDGKDVYIDVPIGSRITRENVPEYIFEPIELLEEGQTALLAKGGSGGRGNEHFKSSTNVRPKEQTDGKEGDEGTFFVEVALVIDAGFVGLPNAGKSSLLNTLTRARAKVGAYPFTTLEPHLGELYGFILADIPGLIEGASKGKGLGHKFLRHVLRTKVLLHCVSCEHGDDMEQVYTTIRNELEEYGRGLSQKPEIILLTKSDTVSAEEAQRAVSRLQRHADTVISVSILDDACIKNLQDSLIKELRRISY